MEKAIRMALAFAEQTKAKESLVETRPLGFA
jgi:hypothetical protein